MTNINKKPEGRKEKSIVAPLNETEMKRSIHEDFEGIKKLLEVGDKAFGQNVLAAKKFMQE